MRFFFFFGTLMDPDMIRLVIDRPAPGYPFTPAWLDGYWRVRLPGETFPGLVADPRTRLRGVIVEGLNARDIERILFFESIEFQPHPVEVALDDGRRCEALMFRTAPGVDHAGEPWDFDRWRREEKAAAIAEARLWMALHGHVSIAEANRLWDQALAEGRTIDEMVARVTGGVGQRRA